MLLKLPWSARTLSPTEAHARADVQIIDVRSRTEWRTGHAPRARHIALNELPGRLAELDRSRPVAFICQSGVRSAHAVRLAKRSGIEAMNIAGGMRAWQRAQLPTSKR